MKKVWNFLLLAFFVLCLFLFKPREDLVFAAINKSQCIRLFETGKDFEFCVEDSIRYTGTYRISKDTVFLFYQDRFNLSTNTRNSLGSDKMKILPRKLFINKSASRVTSYDGASFSAQVYLDIRQVSSKYLKNRIRQLNNQKSASSAVGSD